MNDLWTTSRPNTRGLQQRLAERVERPERREHPEAGDPGSGKVQMERLLTLLRSIQHEQERAGRPA